MHISDYKLPNYLEFRHFILSNMHELSHSQCRHSSQSSIFYMIILLVGFHLNLTDVLFAGIRILINTLKPGQNGRHLADHIFNDSFLNGNL